MASSAPNPTFDQQSLEHALRGALKSVLGKDGGSDPRTSFYNKFKEEVAEHDEDLLKRHDEDLNTTLIFSGLFSAITSAFIIDIQSDLQPDYEGMNNTLLELLLDVTVGNTPPGQVVLPPRWAGPNPAIRRVQATLYATLCATLFATFLATLGKQWLNRYGRTDTHGSIEDRCRDRERKLNGIEGWRFHIIMQLAPLTIQGSLALLGSALSVYLWEVDRMISSVVIGFTSFGFILYVAIVTASIYSVDCPFQTPLSLLVHSTVNKLKPWWQGYSRRAPPDLAHLAQEGLIAGMMPLHGLHRQVLSPSWEKGYKFDARCITRMLVLSTDVDTVRLTMDFVQEVIWDAGIKSVPLMWIHKKLTSCFDFTHRNIPILIPALRNVAYLSAKALAHIQVQQLCVTHLGEPGPIEGNRRTDIHHTPLGSLGSGNDPDLESALLMVDKTFDPNLEIRWNQYQLSPAHHLWVSHLFVYYAWRDPLDNDVSDFVESSLDPSRSPSDAVITDCLCIIKMILERTIHAGAPSRVEDLTRRDKSRWMDAKIDEIFTGLSNYFRRPFQVKTGVSVPEQPPLRALKLITRLNKATVATKSYELFRTIMQSDVVQEEKMEAARLALHAAYPPGLKSVPPAGDPKHILGFLRYHTGPHVGEDDRTHAISSAIRAIETGDAEDDEGGLNQCMIALENEMKRVKELGEVAGIASLEDAHCKLTTLIDQRDKVRLSQGIESVPIT